MVFFSSRISPLHVHRDLLRQVAAARRRWSTSAMLRTWPVRLTAIEFTLSVRSFQVPATPGTSAWPPSLPSVPTSRATRVTSDANERSWSTIVLMVFFSSRISPCTSTVIFLRQVAVGHRGRHLGDVAHLAGQVAGHRVHVVGQVLPRAGDAVHLGLAAELAFGADLARHARHFRRRTTLSWSTIVLMVFFSSRISPFTSTVIFLRQVAAGDRGRHLGDVAHLAGQVARPSS